MSEFSVWNIKTLKEIKALKFVYYEREKVDCEAHYDCLFTCRIKFNLPIDDFIKLTHYCVKNGYDMSYDGSRIEFNFWRKNNVKKK